jgi:hypothetical protein
MVLQKRKIRLVAVNNEADSLEFRGAEGRNRTIDTRIFSPLLYRLSYLGDSAEFILAAQARRCQLLSQAANPKIPSPLRA